MSHRFETLQLHGNPRQCDQCAGSPVYQTSSYVFNDAEHGPTSSA